MRRPALLFVIPLLLAGCGTSRSQVLATDASAVRLRSMQTRVFDTTERERTLRTVIATLQDLSFVIDKADARLGTVSATKLDRYRLRMTVTVRARGRTQTLVRANAQYNLRPVEDPLPYQHFFTSLEKAMFLTAHQVEDGAPGGVSPVAVPRHYPPPEHGSPRARAHVPPGASATLSAPMQSARRGTPATPHPGTGPATPAMRASARGQDAQPAAKPVQTANAGQSRNAPTAAATMKPEAHTNSPAPEAKPAQAAKPKRVQQARAPSSAAPVARIEAHDAPGPKPDATVADIHQALSRAGFVVKGERGQYGTKTKASVKRFQAAHGLEATGAVDAATWAALAPFLR